MTEFLTNVLIVANPAAIASSILLGLLIGAFYGYMLSPGGPIHYPMALWAVGFMFIVMLALVGWLGDGIPPFDFSVGRGLLWTFTCGSIPLGRGARMWWDLRRIRARIGWLKSDIEKRRRE